MKVFKSLVTLLLVIAMVCGCGVNALAAGVDSPIAAPTHTHTGGTATCTEQAICDLCHERYGDLLPHTPQAIPAVDATCTESGLTAGSKCAVCGAILTAQQETAPLGHDWGDWQQIQLDGTTVYERRYCNRNSEHFEERSYEIPDVPEAIVERAPHKLQTWLNSETLGQVTINELVRTYDIKALKNLTNTSLRNVLKKAGIDLTKTQAKKLKNALKVLVKKKNLTTSQIKSKLKGKGLSSSLATTLAPLLLSGISIYEEYTVDVFSIVTSADMRKMTTKELQTYLEKETGISFYPEMCSDLQRVLKTLESIPHPTRLQIDNALKNVLYLDSSSTTITRYRATLVLLLKPALEATLPKEISLTTQAFETLEATAEELDEWDSLDEDEKSEALEGVRENLEALRKVFDALSFPNLTEEEKAALKEKMNKADAALNDFLEDKEDSLSPEALKEMLTDLATDVDNYWYSLEDHQEELEEQEQAAIEQLHDSLKEASGVDLKDKGAQKVQDALEILSSNKSPNLLNIVAALRSAGLQLDNTVKYLKLASGIQQILGLPISDMETMKEITDSELHDFLNDSYDMSLTSIGVQKVHKALEALSSVQNPTQEQIKDALLAAELKVSNATMEKLVPGLQELLSAFSGE